MNKPTLTIMCGLARSGKSTWIKKNRPNTVIICPDKVRSEIFGHQFFANAEGFIWAFTKGMARIILEQGKSVIIDATNITHQSRDTWINMAEQYGINVEIIWIKTSLKECLKRNKNSEEGKRIPDDILENMAVRFEDPYYNCEDIKITLIEVSKSKVYNKYGRHNTELFSNYYQQEVQICLEK